MPKPDDDLSRTSEDLSHHLDLLVLLRDSVLTNTDLINPECDLAIAVSEVSQSFEQSLRDQESFPITEDGLVELTIAPGIAQSVIRALADEAVD